MEYSIEYSKIKGPRTQNFKRAETSSGGSLGPPKNGSADPFIITHASCFSHCKMACKEGKNRGKLWSEEATRTRINLWSEETIQLSLENCKTSKETRQVYNTILVS